MSYIYFWVHCFPEQAQNLLNINLPNLVGGLKETLRKEQNLFWSYSFLESKFSEKNKEHYGKNKKSENVLHLIWVHLLPEQAKKILLHISLPICWADYKNPREGAKTILKLLFLSRRRALIKNERALSNTQKRCKNNLYLILGVVVGRARTKGC